MNIVKRAIREHPSVKAGINSVIGTRQYQQDYVYYYSGEKGLLAVICDGMGGLEGGETASRLAACQIGEAFEQRDMALPLPEFFQKQASVMDEQVAGLKGKGGNPLHAGTTVVAVAIENGQLFWLTVGDSRIYIIRKDEMSQVNREHNYRLTLKESLKNGKITQEFYNIEEKKSQAEALISYLGMGHVSLMDINKIPFKLEPGDMVLLCSDGLYKSLSDSQIQALARDNDIDMNIAADRLCSMALRYGRGGQDNTSVLLLQYNPAGR